MTRYTLFLMLSAILISCKKFDEVDFQETKCGTPSATIEEPVSKGTKRYDFVLKAGNTPEAELIRVFWKIDGNTFTGTKVSYQFDKAGSQDIEVTFYNRCLEKGTATKKIEVK